MFLLHFQFVGGVQIGDDEMGRKKGWVVVTGVTQGRRRTEGTIGCGACSQLARVEVRGF